LGSSSEKGRREWGSRFAARRFPPKRTQHEYQTLNFKQIDIEPTSKAIKQPPISQTSDHERSRLDAPHRSNHFELEQSRTRKIRSRRSFARPPRGGACSRSYSRIDSFDGELTVAAAN
jgi:hypothetical protein